jgi:tetratricopeptide (TPR) repeat protein
MAIPTPSAERRGAARRRAAAAARAEKPTTRPLSGPERAALLGLVVFSFLLYVRSLWADFTFDDLSVIVGDPSLARWQLPVLRGGWGRPVRTLTLMIDHSLFGIDPAGYHLQNLLWNSLVVALLYLFLRRLTDRWLLAFWATALFAAHPVHAEAVMNATNRKEALCMAFSLLAILAYLRSLEPARRTWLWLGAALVAWGLALFAKQVAVAVPLVIVAYEFLYLDPARRRLARGPVLLAGAFAACAVLLLAYLFGLTLAEQRAVLLQGFEGKGTPYAIAITSGRAFWRYLGLLLWPAALCPDHRVALSTSLLEPHTFLAWLALLALAAGSLVAARASRIAAFGLLWLLINYLPVSNLIPSAYIVADRYMYIASAGFCLVVAWTGLWLYDRARLSSRRWGAVVVGFGVLVLGGYAFQTLRYSQVWMGEESLWTYTLECNPKSFRAFNSLGNVHFRRGEFERSIQYFSRAIELGLPWAYYNRANAYFQLGRYEEALPDYDRAIAAGPQGASPYYNRGNAYLRLNRYPEAIDSYDHTIALDPDHADGYNNRAFAQAKLGNHEEALRSYAAAAALRPQNAVFQLNVGRARERLGDRESAKESYARAAALGSEEAREALARLEGRNAAVRAASQAKSP